MKTMTTSLFPLFAALVVVASPCLAQSRTTVSFSDGTPCVGSPTAPPAFVAVSVAVRATNPKPTASGAGGTVGGRTTFDDIGITRQVDDCSVSLYTLLFKDTRIKTVVISFQNYVGAAWKEALRMTLTDALITSMADSETATAEPTERVSLAFDRITILDPVTNKSTTCTGSSNVCF